MIILDLLERIFNILIIIYSIIWLNAGIKKMFLSSPKERVESNDSVNVINKFNWKDNVKLAITLSALVLFIVVVIFIIVHLKNMYWLVIIALPAYLKQIVNTYYSYGIIKKVIRSNDSGKLSSKEQFAIIILAFTLWLFGALKIFEKIIERTYVWTNVNLSSLFAHYLQN